MTVFWREKESDILFILVTLIILEILLCLPNLT